MAKITPWTKIKAEYLQGVTPQELADKYKLTAKQVSDKANKEKWVKIKAEISEKVREITQERLTSLSNLALDTLESLIKADETENNVKVSACKSILDVSGLKTQKQEITGDIKTTTPVINILPVKANDGC